MSGRALDLTPLEEIRRLCREALEASAADETEIVWIERRLQTVARAAHAGRGRERDAPAGRPAPAAVEREVLVRVEERGRVGTHRSGGFEARDLEMAIRQALAQARVHDRLPGLPRLPHDETATTLGAAAIHDPRLASWTPGEAAEWLRDLGADAARLTWLEGRVVVAHRFGLERAAAPTAVTLETWAGADGRTGWAAGSARALPRLPAGTILDRARRRAAGPGEAATATEPGEPAALILSGEACAGLIAAFARTAFAAHAYRDGSSLLRDHLGHQVFDRALTLRDDPLDAEGLPFDFDLEGTAKLAVDLVREGAPKTPCLDQRHAALLGLPATAHAVGGDDAMPWHPHLVAGGASEPELWRLADGGLAVERLEDLRWEDEKRLTFRARLAGVRRVRDGALREPLPDLVWESSLPRAFARVLGLGGEAITLAAGPDRGLFGAARAPALALPASGALRPTRSGARQDPVAAASPAG